MARARSSASDAASRRTARRAATPRSGVPDLDRTIHERTRLAIVSALAAQSPLTFRELKTLLGATDGNLSVHARRLEEAGYVAASKSFDGRIPRTEFRLTAEGRRAFARYLDHLEAVVRHARGL
ncbi:MAG: transcriptional regulator [Acidobacteriota bacterium]